MSTTLRLHPLLLLAAGTLAAGSCGYDDLATPTQGTLRVAAVTTGSGLDANGYTLTLNSTPAVQLDVPLDTVFLDALTTGEYQVALGGLQENCETLVGTNPQTITVLPADTVGVSFSVNCSTPPPPPPPDGPPLP